MIEFIPDSVAHGGEAIGRIDGKAHFVEGAMPGELVRGEVLKEKKNWARVSLTEIVEPSPDRVEPPCPHFDECGGCQWQFAAYPAQLAWKRSILAGQLAHLGGLEDPPVRDAVSPSGPYGYRNRMDFGVIDGRPALYRRRSRKLVPLEVCLLLSPPLRTAFDRLGDLSGVRSLTLRASEASSQAMAVVSGEVPGDAIEWGTSVVRRSRDTREAVIGEGSITEVVAGGEFRITADAFFQNSTPGAEALVGLAGEAITPGADDTVMDAYAGGGLLGLTVGAGAGRLIAIESDELAVGDLRQNAAGAAPEVRIVPGRLEEVVETIGEYWDVAIVDPPRTGLGVDGVAAITAGGPRAIAYVSCDPASFSRDTALLHDEGFDLEWAVPVDLFPQTFHVEAVGRFVAR